MEYHAQEMVQEVLELLGNAIPHSGCPKLWNVPNPAHSMPSSPFPSQHAPTWLGCLYSQQRQPFPPWGICELPFSSCQPLAHRIACPGGRQGIGLPTSSHTKSCSWMSTHRGSSVSPLANRSQSHRVPPAPLEHLKLPEKNGKSGVWSWFGHKAGGQGMGIQGLIPLPCPAGLWALEESSGNRGAPGGSTASSTRTNLDPIMFLTLKQGKALPALDTAAQFSSQQLWLTPQGPRDAESHLPAEG